MSSDVEGESVGSSTSSEETYSSHSSREDSLPSGSPKKGAKKARRRNHEDVDRNSHDDDDDSQSSCSFASLENFVVPDDEWVQSPSTGDSETEVVNNEDVFSEGSSCSPPREPTNEAADQKRSRGTSRKAALQAVKNIDFIVEKNKEYRELKREWKRRKLQP